jgi:hypothetical protein
MASLPTVKIKANNDRGWCIINASAFDGEVHQRFVDAEPARVPQGPDDVAGLKKPEVIELLEAHDAPTDGNLPELRERLCAVMFSGL